MVDHPREHPVDRILLAIEAIVGQARERVFGELQRLAAVFVADIGAARARRVLALHERHLEAQNHALDMMVFVRLLDAEKRLLYQLAGSAHVVRGRAAFLVDDRGIEAALALGRAHVDGVDIGLLVVVMPHDLALGAGRLDHERQTPVHKDDEDLRPCLKNSHR